MSDLFAVPALLDTLRSRGVKVEADGDRLLIDAPKGTLDEAMLEELRAHKAHLLALLSMQAPDVLRSPDEATAQRPAVVIPDVLTGKRMAKAARRIIPLLQGQISGEDRLRLCVAVACLDIGIDPRDLAREGDEVSR